MMKFNSGDKVFAKIKGYPPWPAKILAANARRYDVQFYGTGETGIVKDDCLFYYVRHKKRFMKSLKRKDYLDAIHDIEAEIRSAGTDGNESGEAVFDALEKTNDTSLPAVHSLKRKRVSQSEEKLAKKLLLNAEENLSTTAEKFQNEESELSKMDKSAECKSQVSRSGRVIKVKKFSDDEDDETEQKTKLTKKANKAPVASPEKKNEDTELIKQEEQFQENRDTESTTDKQLNIHAEEEITDNFHQPVPAVPVTKQAISIEDINIIPKEYLQAQIEYALHVKENEAAYKRKPPEPRDSNQNFMIIAKSPSNNLVGIRYTEIENCESEFDYVTQEEYYAQDILNKVIQIEKGTIDVDEHTDIFETNLTFNEDKVEFHIRKRILDWKEEKFNWLKIEYEMVNLVGSKIRNSVNLEKADAKKALEYLSTLCELDVKPLMLKKHKGIVEVIRKLRRYIGNIHEWKLAGKDLEDFEVDAGSIRNLAEKIHEKFKMLFNIPLSESFWDEFNETAKDFKDATKHLSEEEYYTLWHEPDSWKYYLDRAYETRENAASEMSIGEQEQLKVDKENLSQVANSKNDIVEEAEELKDLTE